MGQISPGKHAAAASASVIATTGHVEAKKE
jgi:hypothetical protein